MSSLSKVLLVLTRKKQYTYIGTCKQLYENISEHYKIVTVFRIREEDFLNFIVQITTMCEIDLL